MFSNISAPVGSKPIEQTRALDSSWSKHQACIKDAIMATWCIMSQSRYSADVSSLLPAAALALLSMSW